MKNVVQKSFVGLTIGEKSYTVVHHKCMKENVVSNEISIPNKAEMSFQMERHWTYFSTRTRVRFLFFSYVIILICSLLIKGF